jgi:hypothetical protein
MPLTMPQEQGRDARRSAPGLCCLPYPCRFRRRDESLFERPLELTPAEGLHHVADRIESTRIVARSVDRHAQDGQLRESASHASGEPHARARRRFQQ